MSLVDAEDEVEVEGGELRRVMIYEGVQDALDEHHVLEVMHLQLVDGVQEGQVAEERGDGLTEAGCRGQRQLLVSRGYFFDSLLPSNMANHF